MTAASMMHFVTVAALSHWQYSIHILYTMQTKSVLWIKFSKEIHSPLLHNFNSTSHQPNETLILHKSSSITLFFYNWQINFSTYNNVWCHAWIFPYYLWESSKPYGPIVLNLKAWQSHKHILQLTARSWNEVLSILTFHIFLELPCFVLLHTSLQSCLATKPFCLRRLDRLQGKYTNRLKGGSLKHHHPCHLGDFFPWPQYRLNC